MASIYSELLQNKKSLKPHLAVLIDPDKFEIASAANFFHSIPAYVSSIFVGGSLVEKLKTEEVVSCIKKYTKLPVILFPGDHSQITEKADGLLFLSLISGRNPEYLIEQQVKSAGQLKNSKLEIIPTGYILIDGGNECAVHRVSNTLPISQDEVETIVNTAFAGELSGKKLIYLEAGSGAKNPVSMEIISRVRENITIPIIVGGGIRTKIQLENAYKAGADIVVIGTAFEKNDFR